MRLPLVTQKLSIAASCSLARCGEGFRISPTFDEMAIISLGALWLMCMLLLAVARAWEIGVDVAQIDPVSEAEGVAEQIRLAGSAGQYSSVSNAICVNPS